jgi:hypothetical protein
MRERVSTSGGLAIWKAEATGSRGRLDIEVLVELDGKAIGLACLSAEVLVFGDHEDTTDDEELEMVVEGFVIRWPATARLIGLDNDWSQRLGLKGINQADFEAVVLEVAATFDQPAYKIVNVLQDTLRRGQDLDQAAANLWQYEIHNWPPSIGDWTALKGYYSPA